MRGTLLWAGGTWIMGRCTCRAMTGVTQSSWRRRGGFPRRPTSPSTMCSRPRKLGRWSCRWTTPAPEEGRWRPTDTSSANSLIELKYLTNSLLVLTSIRHEWLFLISSCSASTCIIITYYKLTGPLFLIFLPEKS